ncbi:type IV secretory system conjugative DNA transfer family protein, partial [Extensimonas vulgaris]
MIDFEALAARLWAAVAAVFFGVFCLSLATTAHARVFPECNPAAEAGKLYGAADADAWVKRICDAQESTYRTWEANLQKLDIGQQDLAMATNAGDWNAYRAKWAELLPILKEMEAAALASRNAVGAANILSLYRSDLGLFLQNAGLGTAANLDEFSARISGGLDGQRPAAAATAGVNVVQQSVTRGVEFVKGLAAAEGDKVLAEYRGQVEQRAETRREQLSGNTASGYFGGFARRITEVWGIFFFVLFVLMLGAVVVAVKRKQNPITLAGAASLAYLLPGSAMVLAFVLVPFLPSWAMIAATLVGTYAMYAQGGRICGALASRLGDGSTLGRRLRVLGAWLDNLRAGLRGEPGGAASIGAAAVQAASAPGAQPVTHGSARWGTVAEIRQAGHLVAPGKPAGFALGRVAGAPAGLDQRFRFTGHVVTVAPTGSGKGIGAVIPNLLDYPGSALVLDVKGENAAVTARARRELGHK